MKVDFDLNPMVKRLDALKAVQVPFAASLAINRIAKGAKEAQQQGMRDKFNNPVPFTLNSIYIKNSTKTNLYAEVGIKEFATKGNPASKYLLPQIQGGPAYATRFQKALRAKNILGPNEYAIPTQSDYLRTNKYGNVRPSQYTEILYSLSAFRDSSAFTYRKNARKKKAQMYYARTTADYNRKDGDGIKSFYPGIYIDNDQAFVDRESAVFWIQGRVPQYQAKYNFTGIGASYAKKNWDKEFGQALREAIASAR
jgi:hypothetical protein